MPPAIPIVIPSPAGVYRISRTTQDPFDPPAWNHSGNERFDDPLLAIPETPHDDGSFRVIYCATERVTAYRECIAHFRPSLNLLRDLHRLTRDDERITQSLHGALDEHQSVAHGIVTRDWYEGRHIGHAFFDRTHVCADFTDPDCWTHLSTIPELIERAHRSGITDIDLSAMTSARRSFTRACARFVHEQVDGHGSARFAGIRYWSRLGSARYGECWALFDDRIAKDKAGNSRPITSGDPDLVEAVRSLGLTIEDEEGTYVRPQ